jgi:hypothetical protein
VRQEIILPENYTIADILRALDYYQALSEQWEAWAESVKSILTKKDNLE